MSLIVEWKYILLVMIILNYFNLDSMIGKNNIRVSLNTLPRMKSILKILILLLLFKGFIKIRVIQGIYFFIKNKNNKY